MFDPALVPWNEIHSTDTLTIAGDDGILLAPQSYDIHCDSLNIHFIADNDGDGVGVLDGLWEIGVSGTGTVVRYFIGVESGKNLVSNKLSRWNYPSLPTGLFLSLEVKLERYFLLSNVEDLKELALITELSQEGKKSGSRVCSCRRYNL